MNAAQYASYAYYAPLIAKPVVITGPGKYMTRGGEMVTITVASAKNDHGCKGFYSHGMKDGWHRSGRLFAGQECENDIVRPA